MDPDTALELMLDQIGNGEMREARDTASDILLWTGRGGFAPVPTRTGMIRLLVYLRRTLPN